MGETETMVIVGAGLAGAKAAEALREEGFEGQLVLVGTESHRPYERPPLSKGYLQGSEERDKVFVHPQSWYADHHVDLRLGRTATGLDVAAHELVLDDGQRVAYDKALLATGSSPRRLSVPGAELAGVHYLRSIEESEALKAAFNDSVKVVIIGAGWIGLETASAARAAGAEVTILESAELPLLRVLGAEVAQVFAQLHRDHEVDLRFGVSVSELSAAGDGSAVGAVELADGSRIPADVVVVGVGVAPNVDLAEAAGLSVDDGVLVDEHLRTSDPDVFAAGDVANAYHPFLGRRLRVEHWANALNQPAVAAKSMLGQDATYDRLPYFFSDQYDLGMEYTGYADPTSAEVVIRGDLAAREFIALWLADGRVQAGMNVNVWDVTDPIKALILSGQRIEAVRLADPDVALADLIE